VFQGRLPTQMRTRESRGAVWFSPATLPASLLDHAISSAHIGLALYDDRRANDRLMGTASGKLCLYMKNALPVITTRLACFDWVEREGCGVRVRTTDEIPNAARIGHPTLDAGPMVPHDFLMIDTGERLTVRESRIMFGVRNHHSSGNDFYACVAGRWARCSPEK